MSGDPDAATLLRHPGGSDEEFPEPGRRHEQLAVRGTHGSGSRGGYPEGEAIPLGKHVIAVRGSIASALGGHRPHGSTALAGSAARFGSTARVVSLAGSGDGSGR